MGNIIHPEDRPQRPTNNAGLTDKEKEVLDYIGKAWSAFMKLEHVHPSELPEMCKVIHSAQYLIAARVAARVNPEIWSPRG